MNYSNDRMQNGKKKYRYCSWKIKFMTFLLILFLIVYTVADIIFLCRHGKEFPGKNRALTIIVPYAIAFVLDFFINLCLPDENFLVAKVTKENGFLFDSGYEVSQIPLNSKNIEVRFSNNELIDFAFIIDVKFRNSRYSSYVVYKNFCIRVIDFLDFLVFENEGDEKFMEKMDGFAGENCIKVLLELLKDDEKKFYLYLDMFLMTSDLPEIDYSENLIDKKVIPLKNRL